MLTKNNILKKLTAFLFAAILSAGIFNVPFGGTNAAATSSDSVSWILEKETGKLTISGNGKMEAALDYESGGCSWAEYAGEVEEIYIEEGITTICTMAFYGMGNLKNVSISSTVEYIDKYAFALCSSLEEITIPDGVKKLADNVFLSCSSLKTVYIGKGLVDIGFNFTFQHGMFENFYVSPENPVFSSEDGVLFNKDKSKLVLYPINNERTSYSVPEGVKVIGRESFWGTEALQNITLPDSVTQIDGRAFMETGFWNNESNWINEELYINDKYLISVGRNELISGDYEVKEGTKVIAGNAFRNCDLTSIVIPASVVSVGECALGNSNLNEITVDENNEYLTSVDNVLFKKDMSELVCYPSAKAETSYQIPSGVKKIANYAFAGAILDEIIMSDGITEIGEYAFSGCSDLKNVSFPDSLVSIGVAAFMHCSELESADFGNKLVSIGDLAFAYCSNLASVCLGDTIETIGMQSFESCHKIGKVVIPGSIKLIELGAFANSGVTELVIGADPEKENYSTVAVEPSETVIKSQAFGGTPIASAVLNVKEISFSAFIGCENLETLVLFDGIKEIGYAAFSDCGIKNIYYYGTSEDWEDIIIANSNETLLEADWHIMHIKAEANGVIATYPADCFEDENVYISVEELNGSSKPEVSGFYEMNGRKRIGLYSIKAINSNSELVQPINGKVIIKIPIPESFANYEKFIVGHFYNGGQEVFTTNPTLESEKEIKIIDGYLIFEIEHFSEFAVCAVVEVPAEKTVSSVSIASLPTKTLYTYKMDSLDLSGLALTVTYSDGTTETVTDTSKMKVTGFDNSKTGEQTVTVEYEGATAKFDVTVSYAWWQWIIRILLLGFLWY